MYLLTALSISEISISTSSTFYFFFMMFIGWFIYLFLDIGAYNQATPFLNLKSTLYQYWKKNCFEIPASAILLIAFTLLYKFNQLQGFLSFLGLQFNTDDTPLGFALIFGVNIKAITGVLRKIKSPNILDRDRFPNQGTTPNQRPTDPQLIEDNSH